jgi:hypothetical protein
MASYREALVIRQDLTAIDPSNTDWQSDLLGSHNRLGMALQWQGKLTEALKSYHASHAIAERLAAADPENVTWQLAAIGANIFLARHEANPIPRLEFIVSALRKLKDENKLTPARASRLSDVEELLAQLRRQ